MLAARMPDTIAQRFTTYGMDFPRETPHPKPTIIEASVS
jgi:hypothetical protein